MRSVREFERFAGIDFRNRRLSRDAIRGVYPAAETARLDDDALKYYRYRPQPCGKEAQERRSALLELLRREEAICIYGTGRASALVREVLSYQNIRVRGFAVLGKADGPVSVSPVFDLESIEKDDPLILIAVRNRLSEGICIHRTPSGQRVLRLDPVTMNSLLQPLYRFEEERFAEDAI